jgi:hypothetical protein
LDNHTVNLNKETTPGQIPSVADSEIPRTDDIFIPSPSDIQIPDVPEVTASVEPAPEVSFVGAPVSDAAASFAPTVEEFPTQPEVQPQQAYAQQTYAQQPFVQQQTYAQQPFVQQQTYAQQPFAQPQTQPVSAQPPAYYQTAYYQYTPVDPALVSKPATDGFAIASFICGITGLIACCTLIPSLLAVIFGIISKVKNDGTRPSGFSTAGLILGILGLIFNILVVLAMFYSE